MIDAMLISDGGSAILHELRLPTYSKYKEVKVVQEYDLQRETSQGWVLLAIVQEEGHQKLQESVAAHPPNYGTTYVDRWVSVKTTRYVIGRDEGSALTEATRQKDYHQSEAQLVRSERDKAEKKLAEAQKSIETRDRSLEEWAKQNKSIGDREKAAVAKMRQYEQDIGKLRTALGDLRMKEILGLCAGGCGESLPTGATSGGLCEKCQKAADVHRHGR